MVKIKKLIHPFISFGSSMNAVVAFSWHFCLQIPGANVQRLLWMFSTGDVMVGLKIVRITQQSFSLIVIEPIRISNDADMGSGRHCSRDLQMATVNCPKCLLFPVQIFKCGSIVVSSVVSPLNWK